MATDRKNYIDEKGNYHNVENLSLADIYQHGFYEGKKACYFKGHVLEVDRWISVKERFPEKEGRCLVFTDYGDVTMDSFVNGMFVCNLGNVTHWKPLPKAPASEKGGA